MQHDLIVVAHGSTNVYVIEELIGELPRPRGTYVSGQIFNGVLCQTEPAEKGPMIVLDQGRIVPTEPTMEKVLEKGGPGAIVIKGANAVDPDGHAGVFCAHAGCGTIGFAYGFISGRGVKLIVPVGLEKLIPSVPKASKELGHEKLTYHTGTRIGMLPLVNATVVTEITALKVLFGLDAVHVGGGGVSGSEGTVVLVASGDKEQIDRAVAIIDTIKGEPPIKTMKATCATCVQSTPSLSAAAAAASKPATRGCIYHGRREAELPKHFIRRPEVA